MNFGGMFSGLQNLYRNFFPVTNQGDPNKLDPSYAPYYTATQARQNIASGQVHDAPQNPQSAGYTYNGQLSSSQVNAPPTNSQTPIPTPHKSMIDSFYNALNSHTQGQGNVLGSQVQAQAQTPSPTPTMKPSPTPSPMPTPTPYLFNFNNEVSKFPRQDGKPNTPTQPPTNIGNIIRSTFGKDADKAALVAWAENATDPYNPAPRDNWNPPDKNGHSSWDRGLFQINSDSFNGLMKRRPDEMKQAGVSNWDDMYDPEKNAKVAKLIYDEGGWGRWYGWQNHGLNLNY